MKKGESCTMCTVVLASPHALLVPAVHTLHQIIPRTAMQRVLSEPAKARVAPDTARVALILASGTCETGTPSEVPSHPLSEPSNPRPDPKYCTAAERLPGLYVGPHAPQAARLDPSFGRRAARHGALTQRDPGRGRGRAPCCSPAAV
jgi:hypothetical protein